jgi:hypothetical protein
MKIKVQVLIESDNGEPALLQEIAQIDTGLLRPESLGLSLEESKTILQNTQLAITHRQVAEFSEQARPCLNCGKLRRKKGNHTLVHRTLFGKLQLSSPRFDHCDCQQHTHNSDSRLAYLLSERILPEYLYLETKLAALMSYGLTVKTLAVIWSRNLSEDPIL